MKYSIRRIAIEDLTMIARALFEFAFPAFFYTPGSMDSLARLLEKNDIDSGFFKENDISIGFNVRLPRRYAGDVFGSTHGFASNDLPRQRYGSLITCDGTDREVLKGELLAYAGVDDFSFSLVDSFDKESYLMFGFEPGQNEIIAVLEQDRFTSRFARYLEQQCVDLSSGGISITNNGLILIHLPCRIEEVELGNVMDLRLPSCRKLFYETYYQGVPGFMTWPKCQESAFPEMLPHLYFQALGGSIIHEAIGAHLRVNGYDGLVYPSARSDCAVEIRNGTLHDFHGFSLVVYKDALTPKAPSEPIIVTYCPWRRILPCPNFRISLGASASSGSLYVDGIWEMANENRRNKGYYFDSDSLSWPSLDALYISDDKS